MVDGRKREDAARLAGMDRQTLLDWVHRYNAVGMAGLADLHRCSSQQDGPRPCPGGLAWTRDGVGGKALTLNIRARRPIPAPGWLWPA